MQRRNRVPDKLIGSWDKPIDCTQVRLEKPNYKSLYAKALCYARAQFKRSELADIFKEWVKKHKSLATLLPITKLPDYDLDTIGAIVWVEQNGGEISQQTKDWMKTQFVRLLKKVKTFKATTVTVEGENGEMIEQVIAEPMKRNAQDAILQSTNDFISQVEEALDQENYKFNAYDELKVWNCAVNYDKITEFYAPILKELMLAKQGAKAPSDIQEGYAHVPPQKIKARIDFLTRLSADVEKAQNSKKAQRKPRATKAKKPEKVVEKVQFLKEDQDLKITSVRPETILGADTLYAFNTKTRFLAVYIAEEGKQLGVKGTSILHFDEEKSIQKKVRKPEKVLTDIQNGGKVANRKTLESINAVAGKPKGRLNAETLLLKTYR